MIGFLTKFKRGYSIDELAEAGPISKSQIHKQIREGALIARKCGKRTVILPADWEAFLQALPRSGIDQPIVEPVGLQTARAARKAAAKQTAA
jgi:hypothetical protein